MTVTTAAERALVDEPPLSCVRTNPARSAEPAGSSRIFDSFLAVVRNSPHANALVHASRTWTYAQLESASRALATQLLAHPAENDVVALYARRAPELVVGMMACLRAGLTFFVLDAAYPAARLQQLLSVARPGRCVIVDPTLAHAALAGLQLPPVVLRLDAAAWQELQRIKKCDERKDSLDQVHSSTVAYLLFTSGTSGTPKCIKTAHPPLVHFVDWYARTFSVDTNTRVSMLSGLGHDPILRDVFVPLSCGAELHIPGQETLLDPAGLFAWLRRSRVTHIHMTPQLGRVICLGRRSDVDLRDLKFAFSGGDVLLRKHVTELCAAAPGARVVNFYGSTETPQAMGYHVFDPSADNHLDVVPVGRGLDDVQLLVVDENLLHMAVDVRGQVAIRTRFLSAGYVGDSALTKQRFFTHPDGQDADDKLYLTGDVGHVRSDGAVVVHGRMDDQVKVRGFRVELADVVHHLERSSLVSSAVVLPEVAPGGEKRLVAYLVKPTGGVDNVGATAALRAELASSIPSYMIPFEFIWLAAFPLLPNGKIDRAALASLKPAQAPSTHVLEDSTEATIASQWKALLGRDSIDVNSTFRHLGGDSLSSITAGMRLESVLGTLPDGRDMLTLGQLAKLKRTKRSWLTRVDATVLLRAVSIIAIVAGHFGLPEVAGSVRTLFVVSGMSFGKYLVPQVLMTGRVSGILRLVLNIALPTALFTVFLDVAFFTFKWQGLLLANNLFQPRFEDSGFSFWFLDVLVQNLLILAALLALRPVQDLVRQRPFWVPWCASLLFAGLAAVEPEVWDTRHLFDHVPHVYLGAVLLGWAAVQAASPRQRLLVLVAMLATFGAPAWQSEQALWLPFVATTFLVYQHQILLPVQAGKWVNLIAGASLFTYLTDRQVKHLLDRTPLAPHPVLAVCVSLAVGIVIWKSWETLSLAAKARLESWHHNASRHAGRDDARLEQLR
jgi:amino acid adenylation domain-containing protein